MYKPASQRYQKINGKETIDIRVNSVLQLFDARDPAPFRDRDLDDDFTEYIVASIEELPFKTPVCVRILVAQKPSDLGADSITEAIQTYFQYQIELKHLQFSKIRKMANMFLLVGLVILSICLGLAQYLPQFESHLLNSTLREGIVIFGWVSLWRPIELLLFDWYPIYDRIRLFKKILATEVQVKFEG